LDLSLRRPLLVVGLLSATCWFVARRGMLRPENFPFNGRSVTAQRQRIVMSFPHRDRRQRWRARCWHECRADAMIA
jgi:hypothetical protein